MMKLILIISFLQLSVAKVVTEDDAKKYLLRYGYINNDDNSYSQSELKSILIDFQEKYNLPVDGILNVETMKLMNRLRCEVGENNFEVRSKWNKFHLYWYFPQAQEHHLKVAEKAFKIWEESSNFNFSNTKVPSQHKPDITLTVVSKFHHTIFDCQGNGRCMFNFDGKGGALAHAYFPENDACREIHFELNENWYFGLDGHPDENQTSFLSVLLHELGHSLGLAHSANEESIMYPWYQTDIQSLSDDDLMGLEALYGAKTTPSEIETSTTTTTPTTTTVKISTPTKSKTSTITRNLCEVKSPDSIFIAYAPTFSNYHLYVLNRNLLWRIDINDNVIPSYSEEVHNYLPKNVKKVSQIFQDTLNNNLFVVSENRFYSVDFPSLTIQQDIVLDLPRNCTVNAAFQAHSGRIYICYDNGFFIELGKKYDIINRGRIKNIFPGIPEDITSAFRYIDGNIYFFRNSTYYKYNEFTRKVVEAGNLNWNMFNIPCPNDGILSQLKLLLSKIIVLYD